MDKDLPLNELTRAIIGCLYNAFKKLGYGYQEKYYQRAFAIELEKTNFIFQKELKQPIKIDNRIIGRYFVDFLVDDKVAVEMKVAEHFYQTHVNQLLAYLKSYKLKVGSLAIVTPQGIKVKRFVN